MNDQQHTHEPLVSRKQQYLRLQEHQHRKHEVTGEMHQEADVEGEVRFQGQART
jgi:hypothetical protein